MKLKLSVLALILILNAAGCAKKNDDSNPPASTTTTIVQTTTPPPGTPGGGGGQTCSKPVITGPVYEYYLSGHGSETYDTPLNGISNADQLLKVQVEPAPAIPNQGVGGTQNYSLLGVNVTLLRNGSPVSTQVFPGTVSGGYTDGISIGARINRDFSPSLQSNSQYSLRISSVKTNWTCMQCTNTYYSDCIYGNPTACTLLSQCWSLNCNVAQAQPSAGWSLYLRAETDTTNCLP